MTLLVKTGRIIDAISGAHEHKHTASLAIAPHHPFKDATTCENLLDPAQSEQGALAPRQGGFSSPGG